MKIYAQKQTVIATLLIFFLLANPTFSMGKEVTTFCAPCVLTHPLEYHQHTMPKNQKTESLQRPYPYRALPVVQPVFKLPMYRDICITGALG